MSKKGVSFTEEEPQVFEYEQTELPPELQPKKEQSQERKDWFLDVMAISLGIRVQEKLLDEVSFEGIIKFIAEGKCTNIITMAGAGISTSAGIPDYRSPGTGLMDIMKDKYPNIKDVSDLFNIQFFLRDPKPFFERSRSFFEISIKPTPCHYFVRMLHEKGLLLRHFTQNIDTLERLAGLPEDKVIEAHGSYYTSHCMLCDQQYSFDWMENRVLKDDVPRCEQEGCTGVIKPDIVMFGESLNERFGESAEEDTLKCDLLIIMGTALAVQPFASLTSKVKSSTPRLYVNLDRGKTAKKHPMTDVMFGGSFDFDCEDNVRDVFKQAKCDDACYEIAEKLGWGEELRSLVKSEHDRIDEEDKIKGKKIPPPLPDVTETSTTSPRDTSQEASAPSDSAKTTPEKQPPEVSKGGKPADNKTKTGKKNASPRPTPKPAGSTAKHGDVKDTNKQVTSGTTGTPGKRGANGQSGGATPGSKPAAGAAASSPAKNSTVTSGKGKQLATSGGGNKTKPIAGK